MSETARTNFLIGERKRKVKATFFFKDIICIKSPHGRGSGSPFLVSNSGYSAGTIRVLIRCNSIVILGDIRRNRRLFLLFPDHFINRTEEAAGSNPSEST